ncbi:MAG TPA: UDP-3-O-(3-hydroxymyristoyl)glucosamine N-acyltransferase [Bryobacteraceae bacterium]|jgi:UDP-3-O-[3-hydroxymyristoyl] glucosamine N-acyltransferase|nr:UDP-3-O-(3-hydroxymyristoyl)glucosamine N-acyltransferase [Bryobacteraceae bacterium]
MPELTVREIADLCGGTAQGDFSQVIRGASSLEAAGPEDISFVANPKARTAATHSRAGCLLVDPSFKASADRTLIQVPDPRRAFAQILRRLYPPAEQIPAVHPTAVVAPTARIGTGCYIGPYTVIENGAQIGNNCIIDASVRIGARVVIGNHCTIHSHVTLYEGVRIGNRAILHSGAVIGADGFGFALAGDHYEKFPQVGTVVLEDDVEVGANCCIDRAALGVTRIGTGTKLDNLVHIAHNCTVGKHVVIAAQSGFAGGVTIGDYAVIGGQVGIGEKAVIEARAVVGSGAGILSFQRVHAGEPVWGTPARPLRQHLKGLANVNKIAELKNQVRDLAHRLKELEQQGR